MFWYQFRQWAALTTSMLVGVAQKLLDQPGAVASIVHSVQSLLAPVASIVHDNARGAQQGNRGPLGKLA